jgi:hypothetical protein
MTVCDPAGVPVSWSQPEGASAVMGYGWSGEVSGGIKLKAYLYNNDNKSFSQ